MGLLGRIGKNFAGQFGESGAMQRGEYMDDVFTQARKGSAPWNLGHYASAPLVHGAMGAAGGALLGGAQGDPGGGALTGAALMGGASGAISGGIVLKRLVQAMMRAGIPEEQAVGQAAQVVQKAQSNPDARAQLERIIGKIDWGGQ